MSQETKTKTMHEQILESLDLKTGDTVRITHKVPSYNLGWRNSWIEDMDEFIGKTTVITDTHRNSGIGIHIDGLGSYNFPAQSIEVVSRAKSSVDIELTSDYTANVAADGSYVQVGCQKISYAKVKEVCLAMVERQSS
jgi:hypothetical protein